MFFKACLNNIKGNFAKTILPMMLTIFFDKFRCLLQQIEVHILVFNNYITDV
ncbi:hypothetical protein P20311_0616 [Pseudoalteromonas sp. BSi20311]|nr:hypothetical protein P20311_0616 [Pseudoalteromonas sp. BSi20311]GAA70678.1 hypothetical protein P20439_0744 [Pseudoalteromonas sp. BSi20439]